MCYIARNMNGGKQKGDSDNRYGISQSARSHRKHAAAKDRLFQDWTQEQPQNKKLLCGNGWHYVTAPSGQIRKGACCADAAKDRYRVARPAREKPALWRNDR